MIICTPRQAREIYNKAAQSASDVADNLTMPEDYDTYNEFRRERFQGKPNLDSLGSGSFRWGFKVRGYVLKVPTSWQGARQNIVEHYTAMSDLPFTPRGTFLIIHTFQGYEIPVLAVPFQDLAIRDFNKGGQESWRVMSDYNYTGDWAQFGKTSNGKLALTDWALCPGDLDNSGNKYGSDDKFSCGCCMTCHRGSCNRCQTDKCDECNIHQCSKCDNNLCDNCTCGHCSKDSCNTSRCHGCRTPEQE